MGCFSFICPQCGDPINSDSFSGEHCTLMLVRDGRIIESMIGEYDSYGRVFSAPTRIYVNCGRNEWSMEWDDVCDILFSGDRGTGMAAYHTGCWKRELARGCGPRVSERDPEQGWGEYRHAREV